MSIEQHFCATNPLQNLKQKGEHAQRNAYVSMNIIVKIETQNLKE
jgi:hypothetical protein